MMRLGLSMMWLLFSSSQVAAFSTMTTSKMTTKPAVRLYAEDSSSSSSASTTETTSESAQQPPKMYIPVSFDEMIKQVSSTMEDAVKSDKKRQIIRIMLPRSPDNDQFGTFYETNVVNPDKYVDTVLVPPDETWQGGIMQLYRAASLATQEILR